MEALAGFPRADIKLALEVQQKVREKLVALGLDPKSTTGTELYRALEIKLVQDEQTVRRYFGLDDNSAEEDMLLAVQAYLKKETNKQKVFVIKQMALRNILKKLKPKATMKTLGYRSMDSMFKHEPIVQLLAATQMVEDREWQTARLEAYKKLQSCDFELRNIQYLVPTGKKWPELAYRITHTHHNTIITVAELGGVVLLPTRTSLPAITILTSLLGLRAANDIRYLSSILKLQQVRPDFGNIVSENVKNETSFKLDFIDQNISWRLVHWFYNSRHATFHPETFEPHLQRDDFFRHDTHLALADMHETLKFWQGSTMLAFLENDTPISLNVLDVAIGVCNKLDYANRAVHFMRESLGRELIARYLNKDTLQTRLAETLGTNLVPEYEFDA